MAARILRKTSAPPFLPLGTMSDEQVLARLVHSVSPDPTAEAHARTLLSRVEDLAGLSRAAPHDLGASTDRERRIACAVAAGIELGIRCCERKERIPLAIRSSADVVRVLGPRLRLLDHEQLWIVALDSANHVSAIRRLAEGGRHGCAVLARDVLRMALSLSASSFVLAHNHPGGDPAPSRHDLVLTERVARAASFIGLPLVDHVIVTRAAHSSLLDLGMLEATGDNDRTPHLVSQNSSWP